MASIRVGFVVTGMKVGDYMVSYQVTDPTGKVILEDKQGASVTEPSPETGPAAADFTVTVY